MGFGQGNRPENIMRADGLNEPSGPFYLPVTTKPRDRSKTAKTKSSNYVPECEHNQIVYLRLLTMFSWTRLKPGAVCILQKI